MKTFEISFEVYQNKFYLGKIKFSNIKASNEEEAYNIAKKKIPSGDYILKNIIITTITEKEE